MPKGKGHSYDGYEENCYYLMVATILTIIIIIGIGIMQKNTDPNNHISLRELDTKYIKELEEERDALKKEIVRLEMSQEATVTKLLKDWAEKQKKPGITLKFCPDCGYIIKD